MLFISLMLSDSKRSSLFILAPCYISALHFEHFPWSKSSMVKGIVQLGHFIAPEFIMLFIINPESLVTFMVSSSIGLGLIGTGRAILVEGQTILDVIANDPADEFFNC